MAAGKAHISAYLKMPNVEIAALCGVDDAVIENGCKMVEATGKKRPPTFKDIRRVLDDRSIDAVSIATPNFRRTLQTIWAVQAGKDVLVEKPVSYNMFEAQADHRRDAEYRPDRPERHRRSALAS